MPRPTSPRNPERKGGAKRTAAGAPGEMRLQRALARAGIASRRAAEELIREGKVRVDGKPATLGMKVNPAKQRITVGGRAAHMKARRWLAFHKPMGVVTTASDEEFRREARSLLGHAPE